MQQSDTEKTCCRSEKMNIEERVKQPEYQNWVKGTLALCQSCEAFRKYAKYVFHQFKEGLQDGGHFDNGSMTKWMCERVHWNGSSWDFTASCAPCRNLFNEVVNHHLYKDQRIRFENCKTKQVPGSWGIAKLFMPKYCGDVETPEQTESAALLKTMMNCDIFPISHYVIDRVITARNEMMHSRTNTLNDNDTRVYINSMKNMLQEASSNLTGYDSSSVKNCLDKVHRELDQLLTSALNIDIMPKKAREALDFKKNSLIQSISDLTGTDENKQELQQYYVLLEDVRGEIEYWNRHATEAEIQEELKRLRQDVYQASNEIDSLKIDLTKVKRQLQDVNDHTETLQRETHQAKSEMQNLRDGFRENKTELQEVNDRTEILQSVSDQAMSEMKNLKDDLSRTQEELKGNKEMLQETIVYYFVGIAFVLCFVFMF